MFLKSFKLLVCIVLVCQANSALQAQQRVSSAGQVMVSFTPGGGSFPLVTTENAAQLYVESTNPAGVKRTIEDFNKDVARVSGKQLKTTTALQGKQAGESREA